MTAAKRVTILIVLALLVATVGSLGCAGAASRTRKASIPTLEFAGPTDPSAPWESGNSIAPGSYEVFMTGARVIEARWTTDDVTGGDALELRLDGDGSSRLEEWTGAHRGETLLFILDGTVVVAATVQSTISDGRLLIPVRDELMRDRLDGALQPLQ